MRIFNPRILVPKGGKLLAELLPGHNNKTPLILWKISIPLQDFTLGNYPIFDSMIELGSFTLPYYSLQSIDQHPQPLKSWKELPFTKYSFQNSHVDNIGSIYYNIPYKALGQEWGTDEGSLFFDNIIDIQEIEFGKLNDTRISTRLLLRIDFDGFNIHYPPFRKEWYAETFAIVLELEIDNVIVETRRL